MSKKQRVKGKGADIFFSENKAEDKEELSEETPDLSLGKFDTATPAEGQTKATFYFTQSQLDTLEKTVFLLSQEHRIKTNKSEVMRIALEEVTKDFLENRRDSALFNRLAG